MIFETYSRIRLTKDELNRLRMYAARNGYAIETIRTADDLLKATILGLTDDQVEDLLAYGYQ